ncbi:hypothetical protein M426DRAFT_317156 [Hypoxylon sp. CI-4A]|nr:hypothetical protein M426DRAFT_317156 [Hypoxylon sp. CI-4A]
MHSSFARPLLLVAIAGHGLAQFVSPPTSLTSVTGFADVQVRYKEVPVGTCELDPDVKSYSGYADVSENESIFFWFFEARNQNASEAPLTVWINGGPGSSSMIGLFEELGPCRVDSSGHVYSNPYSWSNVSNLLFIDQPTQVGFSYSNPVNAYQSPDGNIVTLPDATCPEYVQEGACGTYSYPNITLTANSTANAAPNFYRTLQGFLGAFPQYNQNGFHFATESYGGHYGPVFNAYVEEQNEKKIPGTTEIHLQSTLIGNGWYLPSLQYLAYINFTISPGNTYDYSPYNASIQSMLYNNYYGRGNCLDRLNDCKATGLNQVCKNADDFCANLIEAVYDNYLGRDEYDSRELTPDPFPYGYYTDYLNSPELQEAIGAFTNFSSNGAVGEAFDNTGDDSRDIDLDTIRYLLEKGVTVALYAGDADYNCNWLGGEAVADEINPDGFSEAGYVDVITSDSVIHGQVKQSGNFSFTRFYEAGHEVPFYQPLASLEYFERAIRGFDIETGNNPVQADYITVGSKKSTYREGNSTYQFEVLPSNATYNTETNKPNPWQQSVLASRGLRKGSRIRSGVRPGRRGR